MSVGMGRKLANFQELTESLSHCAACYMLLLQGPENRQPSSPRRDQKAGADEEKAGALHSSQITKVYSKGHAIFENSKAELMLNK